MGAQKTAFATLLYTIENSYKKKKNGNLYLNSNFMRVKQL